MRGMKIEPGSNVNVNRTSSDQSASHMRKQAAAAAVLADETVSAASTTPPHVASQQPQRQSVKNDVGLRRALRSKYRAVKNVISESKDEICRHDSQKFNSILDDVRTLHEQVQSAREQVVDGETLLDLVNGLRSSLLALRNDGITPLDLVSCLLKEFGQLHRPTSSTEDGRNLILWKELGLSVSHIFKNGSGCCTMLGPMNANMKQRKVAFRKKRISTRESEKPKELNDTKEQKTDTDKNMVVMFDILRKNRRIRLENLVLNRHSFAQTVENLFALSFLVKDGRVVITVDEAGRHHVSPRNAPAADAVKSGVVSYGHFVFRFDFKDWQDMKDSVEVGEVLMPHRDELNSSGYHDSNPDEAREPESEAPTTPIMKLSRNRGLVLQENLVVEDSPEADTNDTRSRSTVIREGKRKLT